ncbi:hypothetical protein BDR03DRAFT_957668 [Suillus americanus]|nr:hypothetical protein BDR03DRAFT_957668 [Suillus americanus]
MHSATDIAHRFFIRSHCRLTSLRTMQPIQVPTLCLCSSVVVLAYRHPLDRDIHLFP